MQMLLSVTGQASVLVLIVLMLHALMGRWLSPRWRYALWSVVVIRLMMPAAPGSPFSLFNLFTPDAVPRVELAAAQAPGFVVSGPGPVLDRGVFELPAEAVVVEAAARWRLVDLFLPAWLAGTSLVLGSLLWINLRLSRRLRRLDSADDPRLAGLIESCKR